MTFGPLRSIQRLVRPLEFKPKDEGVTIFIPIPFATKEVEITSEKEVDHYLESNDREEFRMVAKRMSSAFGLEAVSCVRRKPTLSGAMDPGNCAEKNGKMTGLKKQKNKGKRKRR